MTATVNDARPAPTTRVMPQEGNEFLDFLNMYDEPQLLTKSELIDEVRQRGLRISERQLVTYVSEGIVPKSVRVGSRAGVFPLAVAEMLSWVIRTRDRGVTVEGVKELVPLWKYSMRSLKRHEFDMAEFERLARELLTLPDAMFAIPGVIASTLACPHCINDMTFVLKDGERVTHSASHPVSMHFQIADVDDDDPTKVHRWDVGGMTMPVKASDEESNLIVMGVPVGYVLPPREVNDDCID